MDPRDFNPMEAFGPKGPLGAANDKGFAVGNYPHLKTQVEFEWQNVHLDHLSKKYGRPIYVKRPLAILIQNKGKSRTPRLIEAEYDPAKGEFGEFVIDERDPILREFQEEWKIFMAGGERAVIGTPLRAWGRMPLEMVATAEHLKIFTMEQFVRLPKEALKMFGQGADDYQAMAQTWMKGQEDTGLAEKLTIENKALRAEVEDLKQQLALSNLAVEEFRKEASPEALAEVSRKAKKH